MKKPSSTQKPQTLTNMGDFYADPYALPEALKDELRSQDLEWRFINSIKYKEMGFHRSHWVPYKIKNKAVLDGIYANVFGADPEGFFRRGADILAVKPKAAANAQREHIRRLTRMQEATYSKEKASQIKDMFKEAGIKAKPLDGYDDDESAED